MSVEMATEDQIKMFNEILDKGCCKRCALRYLGFCKTMTTFDYPNTALVNFGLLSPEEEFEFGPPSKTKKSNPCTVCLGLLQDAILDEMVTHKDLPKTSEYGQQHFNAYITFPVCIQVRDHSMQLYLKEMFPGVFNVEKVMQIKHAWRLSIEKRLAKAIKKSYQVYDPTFSLHFYTDYDLDKEELQSLARGNREPSRHQVGTLLKNISDKEFASLVTVPPRAPFYSVKFTGLKFFAETMHLVGTYYKFSRSLHQVKIEADHCIENLLCNAIKSIAGDYNSIIFLPSGYDDNTVRVLGGRTFHVQIDDPKFGVPTSSDFKKIEAAIKIPNVLVVNNLRREERKEITVLITSERTAPRTVKVLCLVYNCRNLDRGINAINMHRTIKVVQRTPLRVLHQRPFQKKKLTVFHIKAQKLKDNLFELEMCADTKLMVPEFINGDLGRTSPSISDIMNTKVHFVAMDILHFQSTLACLVDEEDVVI